MLNFSPNMLFQYAQNSTDYALNYAPNLPIMLKLPIISGRCKLVHSNNCITLLCTTSQCITNLKPGLGAYWEIYTSGLHRLYTLAIM